MAKYAVIKQYNVSRKVFGPFGSLMDAKDFIARDVEENINYFKKIYPDVKDYSTRKTFSGDVELTFTLNRPESVTWEVQKMMQPNMGDMYMSLY